MLRRHPGFAVAAAFVSLVAGALGSERGQAEETRLGGGVFGHFARWELSVSPDRGPRGGRRPCVTAMLGPARPQPGSVASLATECGRLTILSPVTVGVSAGEGGQARALLALAYVPRVAAVRLDFRDRPGRVVALRSLGAREASRAGVVPFNWRVVTFSGPVCLTRIVALDRVGREIPDAERAVPCDP